MSCSLKGILDFIQAVSFLERCKRIDPLSVSPIGQRSKELCHAKTAALRAITAFVESPDDSLFMELERRLQCVLVLPRICSPIPRYPILPVFNDTLWASHIVDDFLFIGPGSEFMPLKLSQPNQNRAECELLIKRFVEAYNIRFIINVSKELIPGLQTGGQRDYPVEFSPDQPIVCAELDDLKDIKTEGLTAQQLLSIIGVMVPMDDIEEFSPEFEGLIQVAACALELSWRRYVFGMVQFPSQPPPRVYLHCFGGLNRSTYTAVFWLVKYHGIMPDQAWNCVLERRRPQCSAERPPLNGYVNGKLTGKALWKDALKRVELQSVIWPQLQLSQPISQPIFSHIVPSNIINTAEASARAILNKNSPVQDPSYFHGFSPSLSRILCESHPAVATVKQRALGSTPTFLRSPSSSWPAVAHAAEAIELSAGRHSQRSSSQWDVLGENVGITASGSKVKDSRPIVKDSGAHGLLHSNSSTSDSAQRYYLRVCGLRSCVSDDDVFCFFQKFSAIRDQIVSIKSSNSKTQLLFVSFKSFKDAERAKDELIAQKNLQIMNNSFVIEDEVLSQRRIESIIRNSQVQAPGSCTHFSLTSPRVKNEDISFSGSNSERSINVAHHCSDHGALSTRARVEDNASPNERHQHDASDRAQHKDAQSRVSHVRCRHFARGHCDNGANCRFSHDAATKPSETRTCIPREAPETVSKQLGSALQGSDSREKKRWRYIELHGLPRHCTEQDILALLTWDFPEFESKNCEIILTKFMDGSRTGHAYCRLAIEEALFAAVLQCRKMMGSHRVSVFQGSEDRFLEVASEESKASSAVPRAPSLKSSEQAASDSNGSLAHAVSEQVFLKMRGLPYSCTVHDIVDFFQGHSVDPDSVKFGSTSDGFTAWAGFPNLAQARRAMQEKQRKYVGHRYVDIVIDESRQGQRSRSQSDAHSSSLASSSAAAPAIDTVPINALDSRINHDKDVFVSPNFHSESTKQRDTDTASYGSRLPEAPVLNAAWGTPSNVLFLKNLPADCFAREISIVFQTIKGFLCARDAKILCRPVVFVEFDNVENCKAAIAAMQGKAVLPRSDQSLQIEFGKSSRNSRVRLAPGTSSSTMETGHPNEHREVQPLSSTASRRVEIEKSDVDRERPSVSHVEGPTSKKQRLHDSGQAITSTPDDDVSTRQVVRFVKTEGNPSDITKTDSTPLADSFGYATEAFASVASGGLQTKTAAALYKTPSGRETRTWCRYGHSCKSGSKCNFGHENVAQKLIRTVDLRQSIDSPSASHSASLETDMRSKLGSKSHSLNVPMS